MQTNEKKSNEQRDDRLEISPPEELRARFADIKKSVENQSRITKSFLEGKFKVE